MAIGLALVGFFDLCRVDMNAWRKMHLQVIERLSKSEERKHNKSLQRTAKLTVVRSTSGRRNWQIG